MKLAVTRLLKFQVNIFTEEIIRAGTAASLSTLLNRLDPVLRKVAHLGRFIKTYISSFFTPNTLICRLLK